MRAYVNRLANPNTSVHSGIDGGELLGLKNFATIGVPQVNWGGGPFVTLQNPGDPQYSLLASLGWGAQDNVSWTRGRHFLKAGFDIRGNHLNSRSGSRGAFNFSTTSTAIPNESFSGNLTGYSFASYLLGIVQSASFTEPVGLGGRRHYYAGFFQDDFNLNRHLTLNLGMRWEFQPPATETHDRFSNFSLTKIDPLSGLPGATEYAGHCKECTGKSYFGKRDWNDFGPRIGFAWQPFSKWVLRGAYGVMYEADTYNGLVGVIPGRSGGAYGGSYNLSADPVEPWRGIFNWSNGFPTNSYTPPRMDPSFADSNVTFGTDPDYGRSPYIQAWNVNLQRELFAQVVIISGTSDEKERRCAKARWPV